MAKSQTNIPGTERVGIKEVDVAAEAYLDARNARMKKTEKEVETKAALIAVMQKHELTVYKDEDTDPPLLVTLSQGELTVKVRQVKEDGTSEASEPEVTT